MRILVLWKQWAVETKMRNTIIDHVFCFKKYDADNEYFYFNMYNGRFAEDYNWIDEKMFDVVIFHYSALSLRGSDRYWGDFLQLMINVWRDYPCKKVLMPQDDYTITERIWDLALGIKADTIYTIIRECDRAILYPKCKLGDIKIKTVLTGYVEEDYINKIYLQSHRNRKYDVVYRARKLPYEFGKHGQLKYELAMLFKEKLRDSDFVYDVNNTDDDKEAVLGNCWFDFLASSRTTIGCLGGAGFADITGEYANRVREYVAQHPDAMYEETKMACFPNVEETLTGMISPRIFDAALTKTCQILVGEDYQGILRPDIDYIVLNKDFSNIDEVIAKMKDIDYCEEIADSCYAHVVNSRKYSYRRFVELIIGDMRVTEKIKNSSNDLSKFIERMCKKNNDTVMNEIALKERRNNGIS